MYEVVVKSGTNGYYDYDNCDMLLCEVSSNNIPNVNDILEIDYGTRKREKYLVREVKRSINLPTEKIPFGEWIRVYVINI